VTVIRGTSARVAALFGVSLAAAALTAAAAVASAHMITRGDAAAVAAAISLRHGDLPGTKQEPNPVTPQERQLGARATSCAGGVPPREAYANTQSPDFVSGAGGSSETVASSVEILPSASLVTRDFTALARPRALTCLLSELESAVEPSLPKGSKLVSSAATRMPPVVVASRSFDVRMTFLVSMREGLTTVEVPVYVDQIGFADGPAEVSLELQTAPVPPSGSLEHRLATLLLARARAAIG
jgi:hypothetical protein